MSKQATLAACGFLLTVFGIIFAVAAAAPVAADQHRIVFQVTGEGDEHWDGVLNNVENVRVAMGPHDTDVAVIVHGKGLGLLIAANSKHEDRMKTLAQSGVAFIACENTMTRKKVTKDQLLPFVTTVDSGVAEIVRRQEKGWSYVRS